jgi:hypothetical protein
VIDKEEIKKPQNINLPSFFLLLLLDKHLFFFGLLPPSVSFQGIYLVSLFSFFYFILWSINYSSKVKANKEIIHQK